MIMKLIAERSPDIRRFSYDLQRFPFPNVIAQMFEVPTERLQHVHEHYGNEYALVREGREQETRYHERFYANVNPDWKKPELRTAIGLEYLRLHMQFVAEELVPYFGEELIVSPKVDSKGYIPPESTWLLCK